MATNENLIPIPGRLHSVATEGHVAGADEIYDDTLGKLQSEVNASKADLVNGKIPSEQLPSYVDDVINGYYYNGSFYKEATHTTVITGEEDKIYVDIPTDKSYRWSGFAYILISNPYSVDEEDLTVVNNNIKFKDRPNTDGMGKVILRKNIVSGVNTLTQSMMQASNTIYVIQYDFTLSEDIIVPDNCILKFDGGSISGERTITGQNTGIEAGLSKIFNINVDIRGTWNVAEAYSEWFGAIGDSTTDDTTAVQKTIDSFNCVNFCSKTYLLEQITLNNYTNIKGVYHKTIIVTSNTNNPDQFNLPAYNDSKVKTIFYAHDKSFVTISCLEFKLRNAQLCNAIVIDDSGTNGTSVEWDMRPTITDISVLGGYYSLYISAFVREAKVTRFYSNFGCADYAIDIEGTDESLTNCTVGGASFGSMLVSQNCRITNIKCFCSNLIYNDRVNDPEISTPEKHYALYLQGNYINAVNVDLQQNTCNGLCIEGNSNYFQGVLNAAAGQHRQEDSSTISSNIVIKGVSIGNTVNVVQTTGFLNSNCSHFIYILNPDIEYNNVFNITSRQSISNAKTVLCNTYTDGNVINYNGYRIKENTVPSDYITNTAITSFDVHANYFTKNIEANSAETITIPLTGIVSSASMFFLDFNTFSSISFDSESDFQSAGVLTIDLLVNDAVVTSQETDIKRGCNYYNRYFKMWEIASSAPLGTKISLRFTYRALMSGVVCISIPSINIFSQRNAPFIIPNVPNISYHATYNKDNGKLSVISNGTNIELKDSYKIMLNYGGEASTDFRWIKLFKFNHNEFDMFDCVFNSRNSFKVSDRKIYKLSGEELPDMRYVLNMNNDITTVFVKLYSPYQKLIVLDSILGGTWYGTEYDKNVDYADIPDMANSAAYEVINENSTPNIKNLIYYDSDKLLVGKNDGVNVIPTYHHSVTTSGTFSSKPSSAYIPIGFSYFCTDKNTTEGSTDGIMIYHKGNDVWVDALGRVVS